VGAAVRRSARVTGAARVELAAQVRADYERGASIRSIVAARGYSYALTRQLLVESGVALRGRGGNQRGTSSATG
jgi:hypothetical protein